jgi:hypothetical protein
LKDRLRGGLFSNPTPKLRSLVPEDLAMSLADAQRYLRARQICAKARNLNTAATEEDDVSDARETALTPRRKSAPTVA